MINDEILSRLPTNFDSDDGQDKLDSDDDDLKDEVEYLTKDPVRKYQFA